MNPQLTDVGVGALSRLTSLTQLSLAKLQLCTPQSLAVVSSLRLMTFLSLLQFSPSVHFSSEDFRCLSHLSRLRHLDLAVCPIESPVLDSILSSNPHVAFLRVSNSLKSPLSSLGRLSCLTTLNLERNPFLGDEHISSVTCLERLVTLHIGGTSLKGFAFQNAKFRTTLRTLTLDVGGLPSSINEEGAKCLDFPYVIDLLLNCEVTTTALYVLLSRQWGQITICNDVNETIIDLIAKCTQLRTLDLRHAHPLSRSTDVIKAKLKHLPFLKSFTIRTANGGVQLEQIK
jgi:hypothetical protein